MTEVKRQTGTTHEAVGTAVKYVDEVSVEHDAILTAVWGPDLGKCAVNLLYVSGDESKTDSYGRQMERAPSVSAEGAGTAHGRFYRLV